MNYLPFSLLVAVSVAWFTQSAAGFTFKDPSLSVDSARAKSLFKKPPTDYSTGPLWVWNDLLTEAEIRETLRDLASQSVKQVWVHPRPGLMTPYLSKDWFRLWEVTLKEAKRLGMKVWIYDENSYPSGFAGGWVPETMPESRGRGLSFEESHTPPILETNTLGVYRLNDEKWENVTARLGGSEKLNEGEYLIAREARAGNSPWTGNRCYVNLLSPGVTERFLELTLEAYRRNVGNEFGRLIPGVFTDEPNIHPAGDLPWSELLTTQFQARWGYNLLDHLPSLNRPTGDWRKTRHNYFRLLNEQFIEHWARPYHDYCETNHLQWTGHYWDHEWPHCVGVPDNMAMYAWHQRPAIDCLMNQYAENTHAQFGNVRMVKELSSVANQLGMQRTLCEVYGAGGWDLRFEDMKRIGDWLEVLGVNTLNQHLSYVTLRGARKRDHPQSFSYHEPWWKAYHVSAQYFARLSAALSQGQQVNPILVLEPTTTAWMYQGDEARLKPLGDSFFNLVMALESAQIEYDLGCEDIMARHGSVVDNQLRIGNRSYRRVIQPPCMENFNQETVALLHRIPGAQFKPRRVDGSLVSERGEESSPGIATNWIAELVEELKSEQAQQGFEIRRAPQDKGILFHHRRRLGDGELLFLVNTSAENPSTGDIRSRCKGVEVWDLYTGETRAYPATTSAEGLVASFRLPPSGSLLLFMSQRPTKAPAPDRTLETLQPEPGASATRLEPNVLTLDYVDVTAGGETRTNVYFYQANQFCWKRNGMERDPWDSAVQFGSELISKTFPPASGFKASYHFTIAERVPEDLEFVLERPDLYTVTCNGKPLSAETNRWWLDKAFGRLSIASFARTGDNILTIEASPFTMFHEVEPGYVLGSFSLRATQTGFEIVNAHPLTYPPDQAFNQTNTTPESSGWSQQGYPFYASGVCYTETFKIEQKTGKFAVALTDWRGSVAEVTVNGTPAGYIDAPPWECDVTRFVKRGENRVDLTVIGTLKNTLGPHHGAPRLGAAWPAGFQQGPAKGPPPGAEYDTVAYGLFRPFVLKRSQDR